MNPIDPYSLPKLKDAPATPFTLAIADGQLECSDILRFLPGKRLVLRAKLNGQAIIAKCFFGPQAKRDRQREVRGIHGFINAGIRTPDLITELDDSAFQLVITEELISAESFEQFWLQPLTNDQRRLWLINLGRMIAALHKSGVVQKDFHLDNLLLHNEQLYIIDGGCVEVVGQKLSQAAALKNLALFQAVLYPKYDKLLNDIWTAYSTAAPELAKQTSITEFSGLVQKQRKWREKFVHKALRNCTQFRVEKSWHHFLSVDKQLDNPALRAVLADPDRAIVEGKIIKFGRTNTVAVLTLGSGEKVLIKRFKSTKGFLHKYLRCLRPSRARGCWLNGHLLTMLGIATPRPYAMLEKRFGPLTTCSYIITAYQPAPHAMDWFTQSPLPGNYQSVVDKIDEMLTTLQRALVYHGDLKGNNILIVDGEPVLIDLDAMTSYKTPSEFLHANKKDINRFSRNWAGLPDSEEAFSPVISKLRNRLD